MAKTAKVDSRTARAKLPVAHDPYWHKAGHALSLGYRKGSDKASSWIARGYDGAKYRKATLGEPDDRREPDGDKVLSFSQAIEKAFAWWNNRDVKIEAPAVPITVDIATQAYLAAYKARGGKDLRSVESRIKLHIKPTFAAVEVARLTKPEIETWLFALASQPRLYRPGKLGRPAKLGSLDVGDPDAIRKRQSAANRTLTVLKAILNHAFAAHDAIETDKAWRTVKPFASVDAARERSLSEKEVSALLRSTAGPFRDLAQAALMTGCRYGELAAMTVGDVDTKQAMVHVGRSKSGHPRDVVLTDGAFALFSRLAANRKPRERLFVRQDGEPWRPSDQLRPMKAACKVAEIEPAVGFHILRHTHASELVSRGVGLQVVAKQIGHRSTVMTEKHYAHLQPSYVAEQIRAALPSFFGKPD